MTFVGGPLTSSFANMHNFVKSFSLRGPREIERPSLGGLLRIRNNPHKMTFGDIWVNGRGVMDL
jgi:hypothetical protein